MIGDSEIPGTWSDRTFGPEDPFPGERLPIAPIFVPAHRPDRFEKAARSGADAVIVDLEDSVPPERKDDARSNLPPAAALPVPVFVRINAAGTKWHDADVAAVKRIDLRKLCLPKVEATDILDQLAGILGRETKVIAQIETAVGVENALTIARHTLVRQLAFGPADFFLDMGMAASTEMVGHVLSRLAIASRAAGIGNPLDGPSFDVRGERADLLAECKRAFASGAGGKLCIHPSQPALVLATFLPTPEEIGWARRVVAADRNGEAQLVDGQMVDAPVVARARTVLERAGSDGRRSPPPGE